MKQLFILVVLLFISSFKAFSQVDTCSYSISGKILDTKTKESIPFANVRVRGSKKFAITDTKGNFLIKGLCDAKNTLLVSYVGYDDFICENCSQNGKGLRIYLNSKVFELESVIIQEEEIKEEGTQTISQISLGEAELKSNVTQSLASSIAEEQGVTLTAVGTNVQLPVIHGLYGSRILILNNGLKHGFQNWGKDHAPEIDVSTANNVVILKGAAGVRYGAEALGGAIVVEAHPLLLNQPFGLDVRTGYQTNGKGYYINSEVGQGLKNWTYHLGVNYTRIGDRHTPDYSLTNSGKEEKSIHGGLRYQFKDWSFKAYYSYVNQDLAILRSSVAHSGTAFVRGINSDEPVIIKPFSYDINQPNQSTHHHLGKAELEWNYSDKASLMFRFGTQLNQRNEYDVRRNAHKPIIDLDLITNDYQLEWKHFGWMGLDGLIGLQVFTQDNDNNPGTGTTPFIPNYNTSRYSGFLVEMFEKGKNTYEVGVRLDYEYNNVRGRETNQAIFRDEYSFTNLTSSLGYIRKVGDNATFRTNIGTAWRTPNMSELYSFGQHGFKTSFGLLRYYANENGDLRTDKVVPLNESNVSPEKGYKWINEFEIQGKSSKYTFTAYSHYIENFIFDKPIAVIGTIRGPMPVFIFDQANAVFIGGDLTWQKKWSNSLDGTFGISYLWSRNIQKEEVLIDQPPLTTNYKLVWKAKDFWKIKSSEFSFKPSYTFRQFQAPRTVRADELIDGTVAITTESEIFDFKDAPDGYFLLDVSWTFNLKPFEASISVQNLLNTSYRNYLNQMRYFADEMGRNFLFTINYKF